MQRDGGQGAWRAGVILRYVIADRRVSSSFREGFPRQGHPLAGARAFSSGASSAAATTPSATISGSSTDYTVGQASSASTVPAAALLPVVSPPGVNITLATTNEFLPAGVSTSSVPSSLSSTPSSTGPWGPL